MDKLKMDEFIARLDVDLEIKFLLEQGLKKSTWQLVYLFT